jgi:hypothetical protein
MMLHASIAKAAAMSIQMQILNPALDLMPVRHFVVGIFPGLTFNITASCFLL